MMHLQRFISSCLMIGAALFLPTAVLANQADSSAKQPVANEAAANLSAVAQQSVNGKESEASRTQVKGNENKDSRKLISGRENKAADVQVKVEKKIIEKKEPAVPHSVKPNVVKPAQLTRTLPEQASNRAKQVVQAVDKKGKQTSGEHVPEKAAGNRGEKRELTEKGNQSVHEKQPAQQGDSMNSDEPIQPVITEKPSEQIPQSIGPEEKTKDQVVQAEQPVNPAKGESIHKVKEISDDKVKDQPIVNKKSNIQPVFVFGESEKGVPSSGRDKGIPHEKQAFTPAQSHHSGGASKDRKKEGNGPLNYTDKWLDWKYDWALEINQFYIWRIKEFSNQWTNAPPSQPPKLFLFS
ncbi:hypothetical protein QYG89_16200 [Bacillus sp. B190/17]|uniref:Uncharacterized protein n=1 Tax=Bacillus lumedeiriae TaxID=3058829 RepID=A0ABW8IDA6_9BACI